MKGLTSLLTFLLVAFIIEYVVVVYAMSLGVQEKQEDKMLGLISPLFHLVPLSVIITLLFCWLYLIRQVAIRPQETGRAGFVSKQKRMSKLRSFFDKAKAKLLKATVESALIVILSFVAFILLVSVLAYPSLVFQTTVNAYRSNPSFLDFVKGVSDALAPVSGSLSALNGALLSVSAGFRSFVLGLGTAVKPLASLDDAGKYLAFQNIAAWISAFLTLLYGQFARKGSRFRKIRRS